MEPITTRAAAEVERVGFWPRLGAALIDGLFVCVVAALASRALAGLFPGAVEEAVKEATAQKKIPPEAMPMVQASIRFGLAVTLLAAVYAIGEGTWGRALGKLVLGLRIASADGKPASVGQLWGRVALKSLGGWLKLAGLLTGVAILGRVSTIATVALLGGAILVFWPRRQALHDLVARTAVFHASDVGVATAPATSP